MASTTPPTETDMKARIVVEAERLFRDIGYQKTTVGDIAKQMRMSPANVYRFFDSKRSINAAVAERLMSEVETAARRVVGAKESASSRLRRLLLTVHVMNAERYVVESRLHEMVAVAMEQNWDVCSAHMERITGMIAELISDGVAGGEFHAEDIPEAAMCVCSAMMAYFHPQMIAQCAEKPGPTVERMADFAVSALRSSGR